MKHYLCSITEVNGGYEYTSQFLMTRDPDKMDEDFEEVFRTYRDEGEFDLDMCPHKTFVWYPDALAGTDPSYQEVPEEDFQTLKKYLAEL